MPTPTQVDIAVLDIALRIIGAGAWVPALFLCYDRFFKKSKLAGKLVSITESGNMTFQYEDYRHNLQKIVGLGVIGKLHIQAKNKDFIIKDVKAFVKTTNSQSEIDTHIIWTTKATLKIDGINKRLNLPSEKYIKFISSIKEGASNPVYFHCIVPQSTGSTWEWIRFKFIDLSNNVQSIKIHKSDLDSMCILVENELWTSE